MKKKRIVWWHTSIFKISSLCFHWIHYYIILMYASKQVFAACSQMQLSASSWLLWSYGRSFWYHKFWSWVPYPATIQWMLLLLLQIFLGKYLHWQVAIFFRKNDDRWNHTKILYLVYLIENYSQHNVGNGVLDWISANVADVPSFAVFCSRSSVT